jgi:hypothetical protein
MSQAPWLVVPVLWFAQYLTLWRLRGFALRMRGVVV